MNDKFDSKVCGLEKKANNVRTSSKVVPGLAQQLASFVPDLAHMTSTLRPLLKKDITWLWLDDHESSFLEVKKLRY